MLRILVILGLLGLSGCQTDGYSYEDKKFAAENCQSPQKFGQPGNYADYNDCFAQNLKISRALGNLAAAQVAQRQSGGSVYVAPAGVPTTDAPPYQNILPPTVRCQSVNAGLGTVQTICR